MHSTFKSAVLSSAALLATTSLALNTVDVKSQNFVDSQTGNRFEILGVDYQPGGEEGYQPGVLDPLSNGTNCMRDAALMQMLGVNTLRSYNLDPTLNHDDCASIFNAVGIYMIIDVNSPLAGGSIDRSNPQDSYNLDYVNRTFGIIDAFRNYPNTLGFFAANELINDDPSSGPNPPYIRAVQRDMKMYLAARGGRTIPVGYSAADVKDLRHDQTNYLQCAINGDDNDISRSDFFAINSYSWCGDSSFQTSGYNDLAQLFANTTMPVFFSEYGCNNVEPRTFQEVGTLYGPQMTVFSGGLVYEWSQEENNYGLVQINPDGSSKLLGDYNALMKQYSQLNQTLLSTHNDTATSLKPPPCDASLITNPAFSTDFDLPDAPQGTDDLIRNGAGGQTGQIKPVGATQVQDPVQDASGKPLTNLSIKPMPSANAPNPNAAQASGTPTGAAPAASNSKGAAAGAAVPSTGVWALGAMALGWLVV